MNKRNNTTVTNNQLGDRIKSIRKALKLNQSDFAAKLGSTATSISEIENNKYKPGFDILFNLADKCSANLYYLFLGEGDMFANITMPPSIQDLYEKNKFSAFELKFLDFFHKSRILRFKLLAHYKQIMVTEKEFIESELRNEPEKEK